MARLPYLDPEDAEPRTAEALRRAPDLGIFRMVANAQRAFPALIRFGGAPREIVHLLLLIGQYMMLGRIMATAQIDLDPPIGAKALGGSAEQKSTN